MVYKYYILHSQRQVDCLDTKYTYKNLASLLGLRLCQPHVWSRNTKPNLCCNKSWTTKRFPSKKLQTRKACKTALLRWFKVKLFLPIISYKKKMLFSHVNSDNFVLPECIIHSYCVWYTMKMPMCLNGKHQKRFLKNCSKHLWRLFFNIYSKVWKNHL